MSNSLEGRVALVVGLANKRSIAWGIAQKLHEAGATLAVTYQNERLRQDAEEMISSLPGAQGFQCDVTRDEEIDQPRIRHVGELSVPARARPDVAAGVGPRRGDAFRKGDVGEAGLRGRRAVGAVDPHQLLVGHRGQKIIRVARAAEACGCQSLLLRHARVHGVGEADH